MSTNIKGMIIITIKKKIYVNNFMFITSKYNLHGLKVVIVNNIKKQKNKYLCKKRHKN